MYCSFVILRLTYNAQKFSVDNIFGSGHHHSRNYLCADMQYA